MKKMNNFAFTLIELLAVIVILAIIAVIATPLAINVINDARKKSFINSTYGLIDGAKLLSAEQLFNEESNEVVVNFTDGTADNANFKVSGEIPTSGSIYLNSEGKIELKVWNEELGKCAEKKADESEVKLTETGKENCKISACSLKILRKNIKSNELICLDPDKNARYVGPSPNNYVKFNGDERWRIIGVFHDEEKGDQIKIINNNYYDESIEWDFNKSNNWGTASLNTLWNDKENEKSYIRSIQINDPNSYRYIDLKYTWNLGGHDSSYNTVGTRSAFYDAERSEIPTDVVNESATTWTGAIGLMYPSDYGYASSGKNEICDDIVMYAWSSEPAKTECAEKSWLYDNNYTNWTLTQHIGYSNAVFYVRPTGYVSGNDLVFDNYAAKPVLYLKPEVKIIDGLGTDQQPYILGTD